MVDYKEKISNPSHKQHVLIYIFDCPRLKVLLKRVPLQVSLQIDLLLKLNILKYTTHSKSVLKANTVILYTWQILVYGTCAFEFCLCDFR